MSFNIGRVDNCLKYAIGFTLHPSHEGVACDAVSLLVTESRHFII